MKNLSIAGSFFILIFCASCRQPDILTREEVTTIIHRFDEAWKNKNARTVDSVLSPAYIYFTQSGGTFNRDSILHTAASADYQLQKMERQEFVVQLEGNTAVVNTIWKGYGTYRGETFDDNQRCSMTITKNYGRVEILSEHCTPIK
jgi:hypothetical protein